MQTLVVSLKYMLLSSIKKYEACSTTTKLNATCIFMEANEKWSVAESDKHECLIENSQVGLKGN